MILDIDELAMGHGQFDLLVFVYNSLASGEEETSRMFIIRDTDATSSIVKMSEMEECGFMINGGIQLAKEQTHYKDPGIVAPTKFLVTNGTGGWEWLHDVEVWDSDRYLEGIHQEGGEDDGRDFTPPYEP